MTIIGRHRSSFIILSIVCRRRVFFFSSAFVIIVIIVHHVVLAVARICAYKTSVMRPQCLHLVASQVQEEKSALALIEYEKCDR
jgi:hypothetical protein